MPTYEATPRFTADHHRLTRAGLRIKGIRSARGVFELTWDGNGRATWSYGPQIVSGEQHVVWRRIGTHDILTGP
ncbi:hypothetical protein [Streptomyces olivaceoviridis]|uniref:hypothetical protein n=1 Tax=Streptomyces olivaceoviridis TaxID=1921 RepID=UPI003796565F